MVRQALASAIPPERKAAERDSPQLEPVKEFIDAILEADRRAPRKQRHTAHRIWQRIRRERPKCEIGESTVLRRRVNEHEAVADLGEDGQAWQVFSMRSMASKWARPS